MLVVSARSHMDNIARNRSIDRVLDGRFCRSGRQPVIGIVTGGGYVIIGLRTRSHKAKQANAKKQAEPARGEGKGFSGHKRMERTHFDGAWLGRPDRKSTRLNSS